MNGILKAFVAMSILAAAQLASAGPLAENVKRQDSTVSTATASDSLTVLPTLSGSNAVPTISIDGNTTTPSATFPLSETTATEAPNTSFTPFTGTFASAVPAVTQIDSWMSENPDARTRTFPPIPKETYRPHHKCPVTVTTTVYMFAPGIPTGYPTDSAFPTSSSDSFPVPSDMPTPSDIFPTSSGTMPIPSDALPTPSGSISTLSGSDIPTSTSFVDSTPTSTSDAGSVVPTETPDATGA